MRHLESERPFNDLLVICNDSAGNGEAASDLRQTLAREWAEGGLGCRFMQMGSQESLSALAKRSAVQAREQRSALVAVGGDGTVNTVARAAWEYGVPLGIVPRGTFNYLARDQGIPQDIAEAARVLIDPRLHRFQPGMVNDQMFLINASLGLYCKLMEDREAFKRRFGRSRFNAMLAGVVSLCMQRVQLRLVIEQEGRSRQLRTPSLFVANNRLQLEQIGLDLADELGRDRLGAIVVRPVGTHKLAGMALLGALGTLGQADNLDAFAFGTLNVGAFGRQSMKLAIDGEIKRMQLPLKFTRPERPLKLLVPKPEDAAPRQ